MQLEKKKKIGIMGGTFDPIHIGHLILAENAYEQFQLDKILVMPSGNPPHKTNRTGRASTSQRIKMVELAIADNDNLELSLSEITKEKGTYSFTHETLERLNKNHPDTEYYFILGADSLFTFDSWKEPGRICKACIIVVAVRNHIENKLLDKQIACITKKYNAVIYKLDTCNIDISSEMIRTYIRLNKSIKYYVPDAVINYMTEEQLYKDSDS